MYLEEAFNELNKINESIDDDTTHTNVTVPDITIKNKNNENIILSFTGWYDSFSKLYYYEYLIPIISITFKNKTFYLRPFLDEVDFSNFDWEVTDSWDDEYEYDDYGTRYHTVGAGFEFEITWQGQKFKYDHPLDENHDSHFESTDNPTNISTHDIEIDDFSGDYAYSNYLNIDNQKFLDALLKISNDAANSILQKDKNVIEEIKEDCYEYFENRINNYYEPPVD